VSRFIALLSEMPKRKLISKERFKKELGERIRAAREAKGISLKQLEAMDDSLDKSDISKIELGKILPNPYTILKLATLLEEDVSIFYYGKKKES
jgi:transcriptional regulator with XRE-family HTH domain